MIDIIKRNLKFHPTAIILIIVSYIISILFISIGISFLNNSKEFKLDNHTGDTKKQLILNINFDSDSEFNVDKFISYIIEETDDYDIKISSLAKIDNKKVVAIGHKYGNKAFWKPNLLEGNYFDRNNYSEDVVVLGKDLISSSYFKDNKQYVLINEKEYSVIGIMGRETREVIWNKMIYIPIKLMTSDLLTNSIGNGEISLLITSKKLMTDLSKETIINNFNNKFNNVRISNLTNEYEDANTSLRNLILISSLIFIVSIVNVMAMTLFWIMDRKKEIVIRKVLGFENEDIIRLIIKDMITIGGLAVLISMIIQIILTFILQHLFNIDLIIKLNNFIISIVLILASIFITSIIPIKFILNIKLTDVLKE